MAMVIDARSWFVGVEAGMDAGSEKLEAGTDLSFSSVLSSSVQHRASSPASTPLN
jgi:hypothetical protein